jgi:hypothetical protein
MRTTRQKEIEAVLQLDGPSRFEYFVKRVVDDEFAWGLWKDGWGLMADKDETMAFPLWPAREYAELCRTGNWADYEVEKISLEDLLNDLLPKLSNKGMLTAVFPTPRGKGVTLTPQELIAALGRESEKYE